DFEIISPLEIGDQSDLLWTPSQTLLRELARSRGVERGEMREPREVFGCFLGCNAYDRNVQVTSDYGSDVTEWYALFRDAVIPSSRSTLLECKPEEMGSIEPMHRGPSIESIAYICRNTFLPRDAD